MNTSKAYVTELARHGGAELRLGERRAGGEWTRERHRVERVPPPVDLAEQLLEHGQRAHFAHHAEHLRQQAGRRRARLRARHQLRTRTRRLQRAERRAQRALVPVLCEEEATGGGRVCDAAQLLLPLSNRALINSARLRKQRATATESAAWRSVKFATVREEKARPVRIPERAGRTRKGASRRHA